MLKQAQPLIYTSLLLMLAATFSSCIGQAPAPREQTNQSKAEIPEYSQDIVGCWEGAYSWAGARVKIIIRFETGDNGPKGTLDVLGQNVHGLILNNISYHPPLVHFELDEYLGIFDGELQDTTIKGKITNNNVSGRFTLERKQSAETNQANYPWPTTSQWNEQATPRPSVTETSVHEGDLILSGDEVLEYSNTRLILKGNMVIRDRARFIATNVILDQPQEYNKQYGIQVKDNATFDLENVFIDSGGPWLNIDFMDSSRVNLTRVWGTNTNIPWYTVQNSARVSIEESEMGMTPFGDYTGNLSIKNSSIMLELSVPGESQVEITLPFGYTPNWTFPSSGDSGITYHIQVEDSWLRSSGMGLSPGANVTIRDTETIVLLLGVGWNGSGAKVELKDLQPGFIEDRTWKADGATLRVINTYINEWYPNAGGNGELTLIDSKVNEMEPWGEAKVIIRNSHLSVIHANNEVEIWVYDSQVDFDVVARDESVIHLFNTTVGGTIDQVNNSTIYIDNVPFNSLPEQ
ncbi:hypothetical protein ACFLUG_01755 [Chloroflexota bacterium]